MRFDLRLHRRTAEGRRCVAHVSAYADSLESLQRQAHEAGTTGPWYSDDDAATLIPENSTIVVERVEQLNRRDNA